MSKRNLMLILAGVVIAIFVFSFVSSQKKPPETSSINETQAPTATNETPSLLTTVASNLEVPWAIAFAPDKSILVTERAGRVRLVDQNGNLDPNPLLVLEDVRQISESGLHGIALHPDFSKNHFVYLYYTYGGDQNVTLNRVVRYKFENNSFSEKTIVVDQIPGAMFHDGGRIKFGPDNFLYIATGDAQNPSLAQNTNSLAGKILRVTKNGSEVFSFGHRNPQGITWDDKGRLWTTEHGSSTMDELNLIEKGKNYGWPEIRGDQTRDGMENPILHSGSDTWAPSGTAFLDGSIFFAGLRGQALYEYNIENKNLTTHLKGELGRIREVVVGPDNMLYITTSNRDGRGSPKADDDKIIKINPDKF